MAEASSPRSQTSSSPGGYTVKDANEEDQFRETELFKDSFVLNSPFTEMEVENLNLNTEIVEDTEPAEDMTTGTMCEYEQVVLDSEDEEMNDRGVGKGFLKDETSPTVKIHSTLFQKRQPKPPCEQVDANATTFGKSTAGYKGALVDADGFDDNNHLYPPAMLSHIHSPEPGDSTEAALGFVDQYLSSNDVDLFQVIHYGKTTREKSPYVLSSRGPLNLAKKIKARTQSEEKEPFKWVDSCQHDNKAGIFGKKIEESSNFGRYKQTYTRKRQKEGGHLQGQGNCNTSNRCDEKLRQGPRTETENNNSLKELDVQPSAISENVNVYSSVTHIEDLYDIGLDTQIAAEAMNALAFVPPSGCQFNDTHQPENALDGSLSDLTENEALLKNSSEIQNPGLHSITIKSNKKNPSSSRFSKITFSSSCKHTDKQEPSLVSWKMKKMRSKPNSEGQIDNNTSLPICSKHVLLEAVCSLGESTSLQPAAEEPKDWNNESRQTRIKDQPSHHTEGNNNVTEKGIKHKRKGSGLVAEPVKFGVRTKRLKLPTNSCTVARKSRLNHLAQVSPQLSAISSFSRPDSWVYPKRSRGKRKGDNVGTNLNAPTVVCIDGKENNVFSPRGLEDQDDVDKPCFPHTHPLCNASCVDNARCLLQGNFVPPGSAGDAMKVDNLHDMHPLLLAHVELSSNKSIAQSRSEIPATVTASKGIKVSNANHTYTEHHKKPCEKSLPKTSVSVLKELIRLGVPEFTSDMMWKHLRHRRDMTDVQVLFSQHLDDSIIKQQKKILARLNISVASSSIEATHFIADKFTRTKNMLETMALGKLVVNHLWLESCGQANCFIDEENYILRDMKKEKQIGFNMPVSLAQARQKPLLKGKRVYITPHIKPDKEVLVSLVTDVHGQVVDESGVCADMNDNSLDDLLILSCEDDYAICHRFLKRGTAVYSPELVLNGIVIQKLELERHQLFMNQDTRNNPRVSNRFGKIYRRR
ncbi:hypothetical protein JHK84_054109 [Glycine max]|uniref:PAX-interacting protein 1 n=1 Tax=Glycine soja TaxID=3848 RepID=A0A445FJ87_GLYSO|nr:uncharacterized protein LOC114399638 [Glycine soja]KAG5084071.1 hypothetical protein JHK84_054109 [Glycine max]KHN43559.1 PAX-interacting protein 1 [Glycine soja]RZB48926.1 PAX-interacting protein 1 [Glycine soja]